MRLVLRVPRVPITLVVLVVALVALAARAAQDQVSQPQRVILVTLDGARIQEVFGGMDVEVARSFARSQGAEIGDWPIFRATSGVSARERRERLLPFFWGTLMKHHGSVAGNTARGSHVRIRNRFGYSFPGYAEMLTGLPHDDTIVANDERASPETTILEQVREELGLARHDVAVFASWRCFRGIAERQTDSVLVDAGPSRGGSPLAPSFPDVRSDAETAARALAYLQVSAPRLLYVALGETDEWAHEGRYDKVLEAYRLADETLARIWRFIETDERYRGRTLLMVTTDHGRGRAVEDWRQHGPGIAGTEDVWIAMASPAGTRRGEWPKSVSIELGQTAPTIATWLGVLPRISLRRPIDEAVGQGSASRTLASR